MNEQKHFDMQILAKRILFIKALFDEICPTTIEDVLLWASALEMNAQELRQKAVELARQKEANP